MQPGNPRGLKVTDYRGFRVTAVLLTTTRARDVFEKNLRETGLILQHESGRGITKEEDVVFVKVHAPSGVLVRHADILGMKKNVQLPEKIKSRTHQKFAPSFMTPKIDTAAPRCLKATFREELRDLFVGEDGNDEIVFTAPERTEIVWHILRRTQYGEKEEEFGIRRMVNQDIYLAAYPLHDGPYALDKSRPCTNDRKELYKSWARPTQWFKIQPLEKIRDYFGDEVALYFVWLEFYTKMLIPAAIVGLICFIYGLATMGDKNFNTASHEICDENGTGSLYICPRCLNGACGYEVLGNSCFYSRLTHVFDNTSTVIFAIFMSLWATLFLELWKRKQARLVYEWGLTEAQMDLETRPEFETSVQTTRPNKFTGLPEPYIPFWNRIGRMLTTVSGVAFMIVVVLGAIVGIIVYKIAIVATFYDSGDEFIKNNTALLTSVTAAIINLVVIMILNIVYRWIAKVLTNMECPRTQSEYEDSFTMKIFIFEFVNCYSSLFYIAFFKGKFFTHPGDDKIWTTFLGIGADTCDPAGCISELFIQLIIIMVGKQFFNNFMEVAVPLIKGWFMSDENEEILKQSPQWEQDYKLSASSDHSLSLFDEFMEMILQFGFATLFVAAFPLAPVFALINNVFEIRLDARKIICNLRRPVPKRVASLGAWFGILQALTYIAVVTNAFVIAWTSEFIPRLVYLIAESPNYTLEGFVEFTLSVFAIRDYNANTTPPPGLTECRYHGFRLPPTDENKYEVSIQYWHVLAARLAFVVIFEHLVMGITGVIAYAIPDLPRDVREQEYLEEKLLMKEAQKRQLNRTRSLSPSAEALISQTPETKKKYSLDELPMV